MTSGNSQLKGGNSILKSGPSAIKKIGNSTTTRQGADKSYKTRDQSRGKTTGTQKESYLVRHGDQIATPKQLISAKFKNKGLEYQNKIREQNENATTRTQFKQQNSMDESSAQQSIEKSSSEDVRMSSSNIQNSMEESKKSQLTDNSSEMDKQNDDKAKKKQKGLQDAELDANVNVDLQETETQFYLSIPSAIQMQESPLYAVQVDKNKKYDQLVKIKIGSDNYNDRPTQTFNYQPKQKEQQCLRIQKQDVGCYTTVHNLYDAQKEEQLTEIEILQNSIKNNIDLELYTQQKNPFSALQTDMKSILRHSRQEIPEAANHQQESKKEKGTSKLSKNDTQKKTEGESVNDSSNVSNSKIQRNTTTNLKDNTQISRSKGYQSVENDLNESTILQEMIQELDNKPSDEEEKLLKSENLLLQLKYVDRILNQNTYHKQYILYRNYPEVKIEKASIEDEQSKRLGGYRIARKQVVVQEDEEETQKEQSPLNQLFKFSCEHSKNRTVSSSDWNSVNQDLLVAGYGEFELNVNQEGLLQFWTLKNPNFPERIIRYPSRITSCKFSKANPNLVAAGTHDGIVAIWDIRKGGQKPVQANNEMTGKGKHSDAVWEVQWVGKGGKSDKGESLVSASSDGRIVEWSMKKGLEYVNLMNLKRSSNPQQKENQSEGVNFRQAAGFSFDFIASEPSMYLVATDEASVHRCSKSYKEQYLESYYGHTGPIYKIRCNPFWSDIFLTCSADWSCKLWNWREEQSMNTFLSLDMFDEVMDIQWSPHCSTLFASTAKDGRLELWDLTKNNMLDPLAFDKPKLGETYASKTMINFSPGAPIICTGDVAGDINVYRIHGYEDCQPLEQKDRLMQTLYPTGYNIAGQFNDDGSH